MVCSIVRFPDSFGKSVGEPDYSYTALCSTETNMEKEQGNLMGGIENNPGTRSTEEVNQVFDNGNLPPMMSSSLGVI